jgi:hypothetical protein
LRKFMKKGNVSYRRLITVVMSCFISVAILIICTYQCPVQTVAAQSDVTTVPKGLTLSPLRSELNIAPGMSFGGTLIVTDATDQPMAVNVNAEEFSVIDQQYDYAFTADSDLAKWVTFTPTEVNLEAGESQTVDYAVGVPLSAEPGGRYISLFASTDAGMSNDGVNSEQRVASLLYITVLGNVSRVGHLISLSSPWAITGNSQWSATIQDTGTTHFRSRYSVQVQYLFGGVATSMSGSALILPNTIRAVSDLLPAPQLPGIYKIVYTIGLGDTPAKTETRYLLYMPPLASIVIAAGVVVLVLGLRHRRLTKH